jgi:LacI family transcriptional regulator
MRVLAEQLGVTKTTVSLALRGHPNISAKTTERVVKLARELNYRPDPAISAIASQRWSGESPKQYRSIAFICHHQPMWKSSQFAYFGAAKERAEEHGYVLEPFFVDDYPTGQAISRVLYNRGVRGILIPPIYNPDSRRVTNIDWDRFTAVCCAIGRVRPPLHTVTSDYFATTRMVWDALAQGGYKRIGGVISCHDPVADDDWQRVGASHAAIRFLGLSQSAEIPLLTADVENEKELLEWYHKYRPDVIVAFNQHIGEQLERGGVKIPDDVELVCLSAPENGRWSGFVHNKDKIASCAVDVLNNELRDNRWGLPTIPNLTLVYPRWNAGKTFRRNDIVTSMPFQHCYPYAPASVVRPAAVGN